MFGFLKQRNEKWVKARLSIYMDGRLSVGEKAKVESHLNDCQTCRDELTSLRATVEALRQLPSVELPRSFVMANLKPSPRPVTFYRLRMATVAVSVLLVAVIAGDSLGLFFKPEAPRPLMTPAPAAMPAPLAPASAIATAPTATPTAVPTPAPTSTPASQDFSTKAIGKAAAPGVDPTPTPGAGAFQMPTPVAPLSPMPVPAPAGRDGAAGKAGAAGLPTPTLPAPPTIPQKALPVGPGGVSAERLADATRPPPPPAPVPSTPTPQLSPAPVEQLQAETIRPTPEPPEPSQTPPQAAEYSWPVRQFEIALLAVILILIIATTLIWLRGKKE